MEASFLSPGSLTGAKGIGVQNPSAGWWESSACRPPMEDTCDYLRRYCKRRKGYQILSLWCAGCRGRLRARPVRGGFSLFALSQQLHQQREQVDEIEIERESAQDRGPLHGLAVHGAVEILALEPLGAPGGETREHQHADDRDSPSQRGARQQPLNTA